MFNDTITSLKFIYLDRFGWDKKLRETSKFMTVPLDIPLRKTGKETSNGE
jgi:hypothetical protein